MSSTKNKHLDPVVTQSMLTVTLKSEIASIRELIRETTLEVINGIQVMFDEQDRKNDEKFTTKVELNDFKEEFREFKRQNLGYFDALMTELKAMREEHATGSYRQARHSDQLETHETRITAIETHLGLIHHL